MIHSRTLHSLEYEKIVKYLADLCISAPGRSRMLALTPFEKEADAKDAITLYREASLFEDTAGDIKFKITSFPDVSGALNFTSHNLDISRQGYLLDTDAFWAIRTMLSEASVAVKTINTQQGHELWPNLLNEANSQPFPETLFAALNRCISDDGAIRDEATPELSRIRQELRRLHQTCLRRVTDFAQKYNIQHYLQDEFITLASDRYVLPLKANFKGRLQGIVHDWSQTGETCYFEPMFLVEINNRLAELKREEHHEEQQILKYLTSLLADNLVSTRHAYQFLGLLDFLHAKKLMALYLDCEPVTFASPEEGLELIKARHPLLAIAAQGDVLENRPGSPRPLDIKINPGSRALIITGGNAGGKTVCLKTLGLSAVMAMSGLPVPASKGSHIPWFNRIDAFIGDEQSLEDKVSTFTAQMEHLAKAWKHLDDHGLVLLDEFGSGTDPAEGAALAQAVLDGLLEKQCFSLCATHFPALKSYALSHKDVEAASMLFNPETHKPLYKLAYGQVGASRALEVARECGLTESIILKARHYLLQDGEDSASLIDKLNMLAAEREKEIEQLKTERQKALAKLTESRTRLERDREKLRAEVKNGISELMKAWKENRLSAKQALKELNGLRHQLMPVGEHEKPTAPKPDFLLPGQQILHSGFNRRGIIKEVDEKRQKARIDMDGVSLWASFNDLLEPLSKGKPISGPAMAHLAQKSGLSLDLRGMRAADALEEVENFLDRTILAGYSEVEIIHGRGTGALRKQIHNLLQAHSAVSSFSLAPEDRGGDGMTIVKLK